MTESPSVTGKRIAMASNRCTYFFICLFKELNRAFAERHRLSQERNTRGDVRWVFLKTTLIKRSLSRASGKDHCTVHITHQEYVVSTSLRFFFQSRHCVAYIFLSVNLQLTTLGSEVDCCSIILERYPSARVITETARNTDVKLSLIFPTVSPNNI